uniref:Uncharacterized protein n=1 Tax=viral metagenome TaxID=1070528 RepID=A0A6C0FCW6_9ZZZZ
MPTTLFSTENIKLIIVFILGVLFAQLLHYFTRKRLKRLGLLEGFSQGDKITFKNHPDDSGLYAVKNGDKWSLKLDLNQTVEFMRKQKLNDAPVSGNVDNNEPASRIYVKFKNNDNPSDLDDFWDNAKIYYLTAYMGGGADPNDTNTHSETSDGNSAPANIEKITEPVQVRWDNIMVDETRQHISRTQWQENNYSNTDFNTEVELPLAEKHYYGHDPAEYAPTAAFIDTYYYGFVFDNEDQDDATRSDRGEGPLRAYIKRCSKNDIELKNGDKVKVSSSVLKDCESVLGTGANSAATHPVATTTWVGELKNITYNGDSNAEGKEFMYFTKATADADDGQGSDLVASGWVKRKLSLVDPSVVLDHNIPVIKYAQYEQYRTRSKYSASQAGWNKPPELIKADFPGVDLVDDYDYRLWMDRIYYKGFGEVKNDNTNDISLTYTAPLVTTDGQGKEYIEWKNKGKLKEAEIDQGVLPPTYFAELSSTPQYGKLVGEERDGMEIRKLPVIDLFQFEETSGNITLYEDQKATIHNFYKPIIKYSNYRKTQMDGATVTKYVLPYIYGTADNEKNENNTGSPEGHYRFRCSQKTRDYYTKLLNDSSDENGYNEKIPSRIYYNNTQIGGIPKIFYGGSYQKTLDYNGTFNTPNAIQDWWGLKPRFNIKNDPVVALLKGEDKDNKIPFAWKDTTTTGYGQYSVWLQDRTKYGKYMLKSMNNWFTKVWANEYGHAGLNDTEFKDFAEKAYNGQDHNTVKNTSKKFKLAQPHSLMLYNHTNRKGNTGGNAVWDNPYKISNPIKNIPPLPTDPPEPRSKGAELSDNVLTIAMKIKSGDKEAIVRIRQRIANTQAPKTFLQENFKMPVLATTRQKDGGPWPNKINDLCDVKQAEYIMGLSDGVFPSDCVFPPG